MKRKEGKEGKKELNVQIEEEKKMNYKNIVEK